MSSAPSEFLTAEQYLEIERKADHKSELIHGRMYAMSGASMLHSRIVTNLIESLSARLKARGCEILSQDLRLKVSETGIYTYPDLIIVSGEPKLEDAKHDTLLNPLVLIEVLSDSTEAYDRGAKFAHYQHLESLQTYLLVSQMEPWIDSYTRAGSDWIYTKAHGLPASLHIAAVNLDLLLADVYDRVTFEGETKAP